MAGHTTDELLNERLRAATVDERISSPVPAAAPGDDALDRALAGDTTAADTTETDADTATAVEAPSILLGSIEVTGIRGIAGTQKLGFTKGPGLTLVVGRNGSGKSTFAEAAELALTGT